MSSVVLQWPSFGPYHTARLSACKEMADEGVKVIGLAVAGQVQGRPWVADDNLNGVEVITLFPDATYHELNKADVKLKMMQTLDSINPDVIGISGYGMNDSRTALRWCCKNGKTRVLMTESKEDDAPRYWWKELYKRHLVAQFDSAHCGGTPHRAYLEDLGMNPNRIFGSYDVVDNESFKTAADQARNDPSQYSHLPGLSSIEESAPYFLVSSRFIERKNLSCLLDAYQSYRRDNASGWRLIILGTGPLEDDLKQQVAAGEIPDVTFAGFQQFNELVAYYAFAGAFIHPALQEQWGLVVNEAMACGLPVGVSQTVGAAYDLVKDGVNGFRFDPASSASIQDTLSRLSSEGTDLEKFSRESLDIISEWTPRDFAENFWAAVKAGKRVY